MKSLLRASLFCALAAGATACGEGSFEPPAPAQIIAEAPTDRSPGALGAAFSPPLSVRVVDKNGNPVAGVPVTWTVTGGGSLSGVDATTDAEGRARASWTLSTQAGVQQYVEASVAGVQQAARFTSTTVVGIVSVRVLSGNDQTGTVGTALPQPVVVEVRGTADKPVVGVQVSMNGGGTMTPANAVTDAQGRVSLTWTMPATPGEVLHIVQVPGAAPFSQVANVRATAQAGPPASMEVSLLSAGPYIVLDRGHSVTVGVRDALGNVLSGVQVTGTVEAGGGTVTGPATTDASGYATLTWTTGTTEGSEQRLRLNAGGLSSTVTREGHYVWVTPASPAAGTVVTTPTLEVRAGGSHYLGGFSCATGTPCVTVTYGGRTATLGRLPTNLTWVGTLDLAGLPAGPLDLVFRMEYQGHSDEETVRINYQP